MSENDGGQNYCRALRASPSKSTKLLAILFLTMVFFFQERVPVERIVRPILLIQQNFFKISEGCHQTRKKYTQRVLTLEHAGKSQGLTRNRKIWSDSIFFQITSQLPNGRHWWVTQVANEGV